MAAGHGLLSALLSGLASRRVLAGGDDRGARISGREQLRRGPAQPRADIAAGWRTGRQGADRGPRPRLSALALVALAGRHHRLQAIGVVVARRGRIAIDRLVDSRAVLLA